MFSVPPVPAAIVNPVAVVKERLPTFLLPSRVIVVPEVNALPIVIVSVPLNSGRPSGFQFAAVPQFAFTPPPSHVVPALTGARAIRRVATNKRRKRCED